MDRRRRFLHHHRRRADCMETADKRRRTREFYRKLLASPRSHARLYRSAHDALPIFDEDVSYIITGEERTAWKRLTKDEERESFIENFWLRRDPTPDSIDRHTTLFRSSTKTFPTSSPAKSGLHGNG